MVKTVVKSWLAKWLATVSFIVACAAIVLALVFNAQQNAKTNRNLRAAQELRCEQAQAGRERVLKIADILRDLDSEQDGQVSPTTDEFRRRLAVEYERLPECELIRKEH